MTKLTKKQSNKHIIGFLFRLFRIAPFYLSLQIFGEATHALLSAAVAPIFVSQLLTSVSNGTATIHGSIQLLIWYFVIVFTATVLMPRITILAAFIGESRIERSILHRILEHLTKKSLGYHANQMGGGIVSNANKLAGSIERFWDTIVWSVVPILVSLVSVCVALSFLFWQYAIILAVLSITFIVVVIKSQLKIVPISKDVAKKSSKVTAYFADVIGNISAVKAFAMADAELDSYKKRTDLWYKANMREMKSVLIISSIFSIISVAMNISAFVAAILATEYHIANIGVIYLVLTYTLNIASRLWDTTNATRNFIRVIGDATPMINTLNEDIEVKDPVEPEVSKILAGKIVFQNMTFTHSETESPLFNKFSLCINPGEQIGLVGRSGSGKTSLTRLLLRFSDIEKGKILVDDQDITKITQDDLHRAIAYVPQEPILFHRSLRENIAYGKPDATNKQIRHAAEQANALEFIDKLPKGMNTLVGERGIKLSGGQRQRIAIARAILKDAPILVLDEATSALDSETERLIQDALKKLMTGRTSIVVAHRLSTIAKLDRIVVLENGDIIEQGSHSELLADNGIYANLWKRQSGGFIEEETEESSAV